VPNSFKCVTPKCLQHSTQDAYLGANLRQGYEDTQTNGIKDYILLAFTVFSFINYSLQVETRLVSYKLFHLSEEQAKNIKRDLGGIYVTLTVGRGDIRYRVFQKNV
jgi:hypothetical protein